MLSVLVLVPLLPWVMRDVWRVKRTLPADLPLKRLDRPVFCAMSLVVLMLMVLLFLFGDTLPFQLVPPSAAVIGASLALLVLYGTRVEPVDKVLRDVDWKTLLFITCMFLMVEAFTRTGIIHSLRKYGRMVRHESALCGDCHAGGVAAASSVLANIPVVAAMILLVKGYCVAAELVPEMALGPAFTAWPALTLPIFVAMMFGGTLGGNATLIGASANIVSAGISAAHGRPISFMTFARYGIPLVTLSACFVGLLRTCPALDDRTLGGGKTNRVIPADPGSVPAGRRIQRLSLSCFHQRVKEPLLFLLKT